MHPASNFRFDAASVLNQGARDYQEDALVTDFPLGGEFGFAVLADGMGGHAAGDVASKIIVTEVFSELTFQAADLESLEANVESVLRSAALAANECVRGHVQSNPETHGMGSTLIAPIFLSDKLYWISIGDSPLYLFRDGELKQLNEDHSLAPQIDLMVKTGLMDPEVARTHPDRNCLTSVLIGDEVARIDCPTEATQLEDGDILIVSSDGLQFLDDELIAQTIHSHQADDSEIIADALLAELHALSHPDQDNVSYSVIKFQRLNETEEVEPVEQDETSAPELQLAASSAAMNDASGDDSKAGPGMTFFLKAASYGRGGK